MTLCMSLPNGTTTAFEQFKSLTLYDDIKCITVNGQTIIYVEADLICHVMINQFAQKNIWKALVIVYAYL